MCATDCGTTSDLKHPTPQSSDLLLESAYASPARSQLKTHGRLIAGERSVSIYSPALSVTSFAQMRLLSQWKHRRAFPQPVITHLEADVITMVKEET